MRTISNACNIEARCITDLFRISLADIFLEGRNLAVLHEADRTAAKTGASHTGTNDAILLPGQFSQRIQLFARNIIVVTQGKMRIIHELAEFLDVIALKRKREAELNAKEIEALRSLERTYNDVCISR